MSFRGEDPKPQSLTAQESDSGGNVEVKADNTSNTASSDATIKAQVAGTSAGDPALELEVNGTTTWKIGIDNSDSDNLKIAPNADVGTSTAIDLDSSGNMEVTGSVTTKGDFKVDESGNVGTISWAPSTTRTITIPDATDTVACLGEAQTFSGNNTFSGWVKLATSGGTAGELDHYEESYSYTTTLTNSDAGNTAQVTLTMTRIGNLVTLMCENVSGGNTSFTKSNTSNVTITTALPARFRPTHAVFGTTWSTINSSLGISTFQVGDAGSIAWYGFNDSWSTGSTVLRAWSISYVV